MARYTKPLTDKEITHAKPKAKEYKLFDGAGLYLTVSPKGHKRWRLKYQFDKKEKRISLGVYPTISLSEARHQREILKKQIQEGIDPSQIRKDAKVTIKQDEVRRENTFKNISQLWHVSYKDQVSENYHNKLDRALQRHLYKTYTLSNKSKLSIKNKSIDEVTRKDIIAILEDIKKQGLDETAKRTAMLLNKIFKYAVTHEYTPRNIIADIDLSIVLGKREKKNYPTFIKEKDIKGLLHNIDEYQGDYYTNMALKVLPYVFVRSYNIRFMEWVEIDFDNKEWIIPSEKMKTKEEFILPLPQQVMELLEELKENSTNSKYVFPSFRSDGKPLSDNTLISAFRRMGYTKEEFVPHGFRSMFSTIAYEKANEKDGHGYTGEVIEALLSHKETNKVKGAYNRASYKEAMRGLIDWYADKLDSIKRGTN